MLDRLAPGSRRFLFHLNLTFTARLPGKREVLCRELERKGIEVWNGLVSDTTRRTIQRRCRELRLASTLASQEGDPDELLIVKTDLNYGGSYERRLTAEERERLGLPEPSAHIRGPGDYRVIPRREVDNELWSDPGLVIERYIQNSRRSYFRAYVLGDRLVISEAVSPRHIKKMEVGLPRRNAFIPLRDLKNLREPVMDWVAPSLLRTLLTFLEGFGLAFGALDLVEDDGGQAFIIDVNPTPYWGTEVYGELLDFLAPGLHPSPVRKS